MKAAYFTEFSGPVRLETLPDPAPSPRGVVVKVGATGLCRSDWHGWKGHDSDVKLPHVPGHELAGEIVAVGAEVRRLRVGDRVTVPFVSGCGSCPQCAAGQQQVCDRQFQPGFTHWGSFAEYVALEYADGNVVVLPEEIDYVTAASLGCRFVTSFRAVVDQARTRGGEWVAVHGCGGVGLSAIMIAAALGAQPIAIDIAEDKLALAKSLGAVATIHAGGLSGAEVVEAVRATTGEFGAQVSIDALGSPATCFNSIACLRKRGRHVQVGLMVGGHNHPQIPMDRVIAWELEIYGSHGMQSHRYGAMFDMIRAGRLAPARMIGNRIALAEAPSQLMRMHEFPGTGITVIDRFQAVEQA